MSPLTPSLKQEAVQALDSRLPAAAWRGSFTPTPDARLSWLRHSCEAQKLYQSNF
jgi:hypothetical protein